MRMSLNEKIGLTSIGLAGNLILAGVIWGAISPWWLIISVVLLLAATGFEVGTSNKR